MRLRLSHGLLT